MIREISEKNINIYHNLTQAYEAEFSVLTGELPDESGLFRIQTIPFGPYRGYLYYVDQTPAGFMVVDIAATIRDVAEFYIIPVMRLKGHGKILAHAVFEMYPGRWQVREIAGADHATCFRQKTIAEKTGCRYEDATVKDPVWGMVTRQRFEIPENKTTP